MVELLLVLFAYLGTVDVRIVDAPVYATEVTGARHETTAKATACVDGHARIEAVAGALDDLAALTHEVLHLADCADDGAYNGSLLPYPPTRADPAHEWVYWALQHPDTAAVRIKVIQERGER